MQEHLKIQEDQKKSLDHLKNNFKSRFTKLVKKTCDIVEEINELLKGEPTDCPIIKNIIKEKSDILYAFKIILHHFEKNLENNNFEKMEEAIGLAEYEIGILKTSAKKWEEQINIKRVAHLKELIAKYRRFLLYPKNDELLVA